MKTQASTSIPSITITLGVIEAAELLRAVEFARNHQRTTHKKPGDGKFGHYDCPRDYRPVEAVLLGSLAKEQPEFFEMWYYPVAELKFHPGCEPID